MTSLVDAKERKEDKKQQQRNKNVCLEKDIFYMNLI